MKYYILSTIPRSGTHLLESYLTQLELGTLYQVLKSLENGRVKHIDDLYRIGMKNNIWGAWIHTKQFDLFMKEIKRLSKIDSHLILETLFPDLKMIYLTRKDHLKQAISWVKALNSSHFLYHKNSDFGEYSRKKIDSSIGLFQKLERNAEIFFKEYKITLHRITYEDLCAKPAEVLRGILNFLGVDLSIETSLEEHIQDFKLPIRQYDSVSEDWYQKYLINE